MLKQLRAMILSLPMFASILVCDIDLFEHDYKA
jgi:hypothetical protein